MSLNPVDGSIKLSITFKKKTLCLMQALYSRTFMSHTSFIIIFLCSGIGRIDCTQIFALGKRSLAVLRRLATGVLRCCTPHLAWCISFAPMLRKILKCASVSVNPISGVNNTHVSGKSVPENPNKNILDTIAGIMDRFPSGVGRMKDFQLKLNIDESIKPVIQSSRRIPFSARAVVEEKS